MTDLTLIWLSTAGLVVATIIGFVILARWSVAEASAWSIVPGVASGLASWVHRRAELDPMRFLSPRAEEPGPPIDVSGLPLASVGTDEPEPAAWLEELGPR